MSVDAYSGDSPAQPEETHVWCTFECEENLEDLTVRVVADGPDGQGELRLDLADEQA